MPYITPTEEQNFQQKAQKLSDITDFITFYFSPWGAAKGAQWADLTGDKAFNGENAMRHLAKTLGIEVQP